MRNASAALVPLLIAVMAIFWFIAFMGGANENLHDVNDATNLQHLQEKLLISAVRYRHKVESEAKEQGLTLSEDEINQKVDAYIEYIMVSNNIE
ncbi:hypothetical protein [Sulfurimonas marina]|uniref:Peptidylprolyl isomerase n=1 Tax=Sulfurimonas marina TaxID=2590551 RepID=A0A7M1B0P1_9BACT|nr:hypothetical protein [Sulfurimonas marina]QOP42212.1 hypothetical protein FJR03_10875 [Sulfurimonas marina]